MKESFKQAIISNNYEAVEKYINTHHNFHIERDEDDNTALHIAVYCASKSKDIKIVKLLLENGAPVNERGNGIRNENNYNNGVTPLFYAAIFDLKEIIDLLLEHGANHRISAGSITAGQYGANGPDSNISDYIDAKALEIKQNRKQKTNAGAGQIPAQHYNLEFHTGYALASAVLGMGCYFLSKEEFDAFNIGSLFFFTAAVFIIGKKLDVFTNESFELVKDVSHKVTDGLVAAWRKPGGPFTFTAHAHVEAHAHPNAVNIQAPVNVQAGPSKCNIM